jgi:hypothetical protein
VWPVAGLLGLAILAVCFSTLPAQQREPMPPWMMMPGQTGRYVVAHASEKQIVILDTTSGKLYKATSEDYRKYSELPKMEMPRPFLPDKDKIERPKDRPVRDKERPKEKGERKDREEKKDGGLREEERREREQRESRERDEKARREREERERRNRE